MTQRASPGHDVASPMRATQSVHQGPRRAGRSCAHARGQPSVARHPHHRRQGRLAWSKYSDCFALSSHALAP